MENFFLKKVTPAFAIIFVLAFVWFVFFPQANTVVIENSSSAVLAFGGDWVIGCQWPLAGGGETSGTCITTTGTTTIPGIPGYCLGVTGWGGTNPGEVIPGTYSCVIPPGITPGACYTTTTGTPRAGNGYYDLGYNRQQCQPYGTPTQPYGVVCYHAPTVSTTTVCNPPTMYPAQPGLCHTPCPIPSASGLQATQPDWCANPFQYILSWTYSPTYPQQVSSQIQISLNNNFNTITYDSGKVASSVKSYTLPAVGSGLQYNQTYYWRVKVWNAGVESSWSSVASFVTPLHAYPLPSFTNDFNNPMQFTDASTGTNVNQWSWVFQDGNPTASSQQNPLIIFATQGEKTVRLTVKDGNNNSCSTERTITIPTPPEPPPTPVIPSSSLGSTQPDWCATPFQYTFSWGLNTNQSAKQVQISTSSSFNLITYDSGKVASSVKSYTLPAVGSGLQYNQTYYWRAKAWNDTDVASAWSQAKTITTPQNAYPGVNFSWSPANPAVNKTVVFTDLSNPGSGALISQWDWVLEGGNPSTSASKDPSILFNSNGAKAVVLTVTDNNGYSCTISKSVTIGSANKPFWREIIPW